MPRVLVSDSKGYLGAGLAKSYTAAEHELVTVDWDNEETLTKTICEETDIIVVDLVRDLDKANKVLNVLSTGVWEEPKTLVAVSSLLTWNESKTKKNKPLTEADFKNRKCTPRFKALKMMETLVLNAAKENLTALVVAPGIMYGQQQDSLASTFRDAWMGEVDLTFLGEGANSFPLIHVNDVAQFVQKVSTSPPEGKQYLVAIDNTELTQKQVIETISKGLGTGTVAAATDEQRLNMEDGIAQLLISNMKFNRENLYITSSDMEWHVEKFGEGFEKVRAEFVATRKLTPLRVSVIGAPGAGKTHYSKLLAAKYYLPHVQIGPLITEALAQEDEIAVEAQAFLEEQASAGGKTGKGKKKAAPKKGKSKGKADDRPRLSPKILAKIVRRKLLSASCRNKGYVLDGFPHTAQEASALFELKAEGEEEAPPPAEDDEEGEEEKKINFDASVMCELVVSLETSKEKAQARLQSMSEGDTIPGHNDEEGFARRWATYEYTCDASKLEGPTEPLAFFRSTEILEVPEDISASEDTGFSNISKYVEAGGKVFNFHPTPKEQADEKERQDKEARQAADKAKAVAEQNEAEEKKLRSEQAAQDSERRSNVLQEDQEMVEQASLPLRRYLMQNVIPKLMDGLLDVSRQHPEDPIDYLAEYLFAHATTAKN